MRKSAISLHLKNKKVSNTMSKQTPRPPVYVALALTAALTGAFATSGAEQTEAEANLRGALNGTTIAATGAMAVYALANRKRN